MRIGDVSERLGIPASTIRYYEKVGLLKPPQRVAGSRRFDERSLFALNFIILAQAAGFTLAEMKHVLRANEDIDEPKQLWRRFASDKLVAIREKVADLEKMEVILSRMLACDCPTLEECVESACGTGTVSGSSDVPAS